MKIIDTVVLGNTKIFRQLFQLLVNQIHFKGHYFNATHFKPLLVLKLISSVQSLNKYDFYLSRVYSFTPHKDQVPIKKIKPTSYELLLIII